MVPERRRQEEERERGNGGARRTQSRNGSGSPDVAQRIGAEWERDQEQQRERSGAKVEHCGATQAAKASIHEDQNTGHPARTLRSLLLGLNL